MSCCTHEVPIARSVGQPAANRSSSGDIFVWSLFITVAAALVLLASYTSARGSHPSDEELVARFLSHESDFQALATMVDSDCGRLPLESESCELADLKLAGADGPARAGNYKLLLKRIGATDFRYYPRSGNLILPVSKSETFAETKKFYMHRSHEEPQPLIHHQSYPWRGPGMYFVTGDQRVKGQWFINHEGPVIVAFTAY